MIRGCLFSLLLLLISPPEGFSDTQEAQKYLIDDTASKQLRHEIDSLYLAGGYSSAIDKTLILAAFYKSREDLRGQITCNNTMGDLLRASGNRSASLEYLYKAVEMNTPVQDSALLAQTFNYLAATYYEQEYPLFLDSAQHYAAASMEFAIRRHDEKLLFSDLNILGKVEEGRENYDSALVYMHQALEIVRRVYPIDEPLILSNIAGVYFLRGDIQPSEKLAKEAYDMAVQDNVQTYIRLASALLERIYLQQGNYREAHHYLNELFLSTRSFLDEKIEERVITMKEQIRLAQEEAETQKELDRRRLWTTFLLILFGCALVFVAIFARQKNRLRKTNKELLVMNQEIRIQHKESEKLATDLETSNATLKKFISIIAHDLKNPFNTIIGFSDLLSTEFSTLSPEERTLAIENTHKSALGAYQLLEHLLSWARLQTGAFHLERTVIELPDLMEEVVNLSETAAFLKKQTLSKQIPANLRIYADRNMMLTVFRNLLSNAIKFTPEGGSIEITAALSDGSVMIRFKDTGVGISTADIGKVFSIDEPFKTTGTHGEKGTGIGLLLCKEYLEKNGGAISVESRVGQGTIFTIILPRLNQ